MSIFFSADAKPCCKHCRHDLSGLSLSGWCPNCNHWYAHGRADAAPGRERAVMLALASQSRRAAEFSNRAFWGSAALVLLLLGNAAIVIILGRMALKALYHACGMKW